MKWLLRGTGFDGLDWIHLAHDRGQWRALVNFGFHKRREINE